MRTQHFEEGRIKYDNSCTLFVTRPFYCSSKNRIIASETAFYLIPGSFSGYDVPSLSRDLDWISVMTYDYHGQWDKITGHVAPMYPHPDDIDVTFNAVSYLLMLRIFQIFPVLQLVMCPSPQ